MKPQTDQTHNCQTKNINTDFYNRKDFKKEKNHFELLLRKEFNLHLEKKEEKIYFDKYLILNLKNGKRKSVEWTVITNGFNSCELAASIY